MGSTLTGKIGQEEQPFRPRRNVRGWREQIIIACAGGKCITVPTQTARRRKHYAHQVPAARHGVAERVQPALRLDECLGRAREHYARGAQRKRHHPFRDRADADRLRRLVAAAANYILGADLDVGRIPAPSLALGLGVPLHVRTHIAEPPLLDLRIASEADEKRRTIGTV